MRSRDSLHVLAERVLRVLSVALLAWMLWSLRAAPRAGATGRRATSATLGDSLVSWTRHAHAESLRVVLDSAPAAESRDWLTALRRAGSAVSWTSHDVPATAIIAEPVNDPAGGARVVIAARAGSRIVLGDAAGTLDTLRATGAATEVALAGLAGAASATVGAQTARAAPRDSLAPRGVLVLGRAGWEAKFLIAALEERGWAVSARLHVAPGVDVSQGSATLDTARLGVVVALDTSAARDAAAIARFVRGGGGLVMAGDAILAKSLASLAPGQPGTRVRASTLQFAAAAPRAALGFRALRALDPDAVPLESRDGMVVVAARRAGAGRVVHVGYGESWRWRMTGDEDAVAAHSAWWSTVVAGASYRAARPISTSSARASAAPYAMTVAALGEPVPARAAPRARLPGGGLRSWMLLVLFAMLLAEWTSRRLRSAT